MRAPTTEKQTGRNPLTVSAIFQSHFRRVPVEPSLQEKQTTLGTSQRPSSEGSVSGRSTVKGG
jgi:hypothetical protein